MQNRFIQYLDHLPWEESDDYFVVTGFFCSYIVTRAVAMEIERALDHRPVPHWVVFRDLAGSRVRLATGEIRRITESTTATRQADRDFERARREEEKNDKRAWDDDE